MGKGRGNVEHKKPIFEDLFVIERKKEPLLWRGLWGGVRTPPDQIRGVQLSLPNNE